MKSKEIEDAGYVSIPVWCERHQDKDIPHVETIRRWAKNHEKDIMPYIIKVGKRLLIIDNAKSYDAVLSIYNRERELHSAFKKIGDSFKKNAGKIIVSHALKGGVGKTFMTFMMSQIFCKYRCKVLVIDANPHRSLTYLLCPDSKRVSKTLKTILSGMCNVSEAIINIPLQDDNNEINGASIDFIPGDIWIRQCYTNVSDTTFKTLFSDTFKEYDYVLIDTQDDDNLLINSIYNVANVIVSPVDATIESYDSVSVLLSKISKMSDKSFHLVLNQYRASNSNNFDAPLHQFVRLFTDSPDEDIKYYLEKIAIPYNIKYKLFTSGVIKSMSPLMEVPIVALLNDVLELEIGDLIDLNIVNKCSLQKYFEIKN